MPRHILRAASTAVFITWLSCGIPPVQAGEADDFAEIRRQLVELAARLDVLEQRNTELQAENEALHAAMVENTAVAAVTQGRVATLEKSKSVDWVDRLTVRGDVRYRHEQIADDLTNDPDIHDKRYRDRLRARLGIDARVSDSLSATLQLATSDDPRSSNQTLGGMNNRKAIGLDLGYLEWQYADWGRVTAGKMRYPLVRPGQSLLLDADIHPEGVAFGFRSGSWFGSAYHLWIDERSTTADTILYGGQVGARFELDGSMLTLTAQYSDLVKGRGLRPFYNCTGTAAVSAGTIPCANGNTVSGTTTADAVLANDFDVIGLSGEFSTRAGMLPLQVWMDYARNLKADVLDTAWTVGVVVGRAADPHSWEAAVAYEVLEKDSIFGQIVDSDFGDGRTDAQGWIFRGGYVLAPNWLAGITWFRNDRQMDVGTPSAYDRLMLDLSLRF